MVGARMVHVMAGKAEGGEALGVFVRNLEYACDCAEAVGMAVLIEPLNRFDAPGYFLGDLNGARTVIDRVRRNSLRLMFDCYHVARTEGDVIGALREYVDVIGHIQFAGVPDRGRPDMGEVDYREILGN